MFVCRETPASLEAQEASTKHLKDAPPPVQGKMQLFAIPSMINMMCGKNKETKKKQQHPILAQANKKPAQPIRERRWDLRGLNHLSRS